MTCFWIARLAVASFTKVLYGPPMCDQGPVAEYRTSAVTPFPSGAGSVRYAARTPLMTMVPSKPIHLTEDIGCRRVENATPVALRY